MNRKWKLSLAVLVGLAAGTVADNAVAQNPPPPGQTVTLRVVTAGAGSRILVNGVAVTIAQGTLLQIQPGDAVTVEGPATVDIGGNQYSPVATTPGATPSVTLTLAAGTATGGLGTFNFIVLAGAATTTDAQGNTTTVTINQAIPVTPPPPPPPPSGGSATPVTKPQPSNPSQDQKIVSPSTPGAPAAQ